jgi:hypothetical protein
VHLPTTFFCRTTKSYLLFPLPEDGEVDERVVITDDSQESAHVESEVAASTKSAASSGKDTETEASESVHSPPSAISPKKLSEEAREKAEADAASIEELRQRLAKEETALSDKIAEQITREQGIIDRLEAQGRRFFRKSLCHP